MHVRDRDGSDRQRNESKGMRVGDKVLEMLDGQTWRLTYDMFLPTQRSLPAWASARPSGLGRRARQRPAGSSPVRAGRAGCCGSPTV